MEIGVLGSRRAYFKGPLNFFQSDQQWQQTCSQLRKYCNALADKAESNAESYNQKHGDYPWNRLSDPNANILIYKFLRFALTRTELVDNILQYFMGATPTVGGAMTNAAYLLSTHPDVWKKLQVEVLAFQEPLTTRSIGQITYLKHVFLEGKSAKLLQMTHADQSSTSLVPICDMGRETCNPRYNIAPRRGTAGGGTDLRD